MINIFVLTNFKVRGDGEPQNLFNDEIFPIYGISHVLYKSATRYSVCISHPHETRAGKMRTRFVCVPFAFTPRLLHVSVIIITSGHRTISGRI